MKKISIAASALFALALCCGFALKRSQAAQELTVLKSKLSDAPITILSAISTASGVTIQVRNDAAAPVTYFELRMEDCRIWAGQGAFDRQTLNHPKYAEQTPLNLTPGETRTFDFPVKTSRSTIRIYLVFLSNGQGYFKDRWLRKLDRTEPGGLLWQADGEETERHRVKQTAKVEYPRNVGKAAPQGDCLRNTGFEHVDCAGPSAECWLVIGTYDVYAWGTNVTWLTSTCYKPFEPFPCGFAVEDYYGGACG